MRRNLCKSTTLIRSVEVGAVEATGDGRAATKAATEGQLSVSGPANIPGAVRITGTEGAAVVSTRWLSPWGEPPADEMVTPSELVS